MPDTSASQKSSLPSPRFQPAPRARRWVSRRSALLPAVTLATVLAAAPAFADSYVHRPITRPAGEWALGVGLGIGHDDRPSPLDDITGLGLNLELHGGLAPDLEFGVRTGIRIKSEGRATQADRYGRTFETETYGTGYETLANPEISLRYALLRGVSAALALEGRLYIPIEDGTELGIMIALPLHLHLADLVRLDTGIYVPIFFTDPTSRVVSFPFHVWLQVGPDLALGVLTGLRLYRPGGGEAVPFGVGANYELSSDTDLRTWFLFPNVKGSGATDDFGFGFGFEARY